MSLGAARRERYLRLLDLPGVGEEGIRLISEKRALVVGAGGLGTPCAAYLVACGVGHVTLVDDDVVEPSNLSRQIMYSVPDIGRAKASVLAERLRALNPEVRVEDVRLRVDFSRYEEVFKLVSGHDLVFSCVDSALTRSVLNRACVQASVPLVDGAVREFTGVLTVTAPGRGPCYECAFPSSASSKPALPPPIWSPVPGVVGALQASEGLKLLLGIGETKPGTLVLLDLLELSMNRLSFSKDPQCPACGGPDMR